MRVNSAIVSFFSTLVLWYYPSGDTPALSTPNNMPNTPPAPWSQPADARVPPL